jgi:hypothetical protein
MAVVRIVLAAISYGTEHAVVQEYSCSKWARRVGCILAPLRLSCCAGEIFETTHFPVLVRCLACGAVQRCSGAVRSVAGSASAVAPLLDVWSQSVREAPGPHQAQSI